MIVALAVRIPARARLAFQCKKRSGRPLGDGESNVVCMRGNAGVED